ncbi:MAG TPA: hypothetical protein VNY51_14335 [Candidatus Dormibacteraeota bacterium]|nr:hypothetical protein [Candidatus Dormibacteraeota bacterium]
MRIWSPSVDLSEWRMQADCLLADRRGTGYAIRLAVEASRE